MKKKLSSNIFQLKLRNQEIHKSSQIQFYIVQNILTILKNNDNDINARKEFEKPPKVHTDKKFSKFTKILEKLRKNSFRKKREVGNGFQDSLWLEEDKFKKVEKKKHQNFRFKEESSDDDENFQQKLQNPKKTKQKKLANDAKKKPKNSKKKLRTSKFKNPLTEEKIKPLEFDPHHPE